MPGVTALKFPRALTVDPAAAATAAASLGLVLQIGKSAPGNRRLSLCAGFLCGCGLCRLPLTARFRCPFSLNNLKDFGSHPTLGRAVGHAWWPARIAQVALTAAVGGLGSEEAAETGEGYSSQNVCPGCACAKGPGDPRKF